MAREDWNRKDFTYSGGYLSYRGTFVARFKYVKSNKPHFLTFLINNFHPAEYFGRMEDDIAPAEVLRERGYVPKNVLNQLKAKGYSLNQDGFDQMMKDSVEMQRQERLRQKDPDHA